MAVMPLIVALARAAAGNASGADVNSSALPSPAAARLRPVADCASCELVPCGQCQEGCPRSSRDCDPLGGASSRNGCKAGNAGCHPGGCTIPSPPAPPLPAGHSLCDEQGWTRVFADEFGGSTLDNSTWGTDMGWDTLSSLRSAKQSPDNVFLEDGALVLRSRRQRAPAYTSGIPLRLYGNASFDYTSGAVTSNGRRTFGGAGQSTRVCVRAQLPGGGGGGRGKGYWPAHWLLPSGCPAGCAAPDCSAAELDILEMVDGDGGAHATYHSQPNCSVSPHDLHDGGSLLVSNFSDVWHEYAVEFSPQKAAFFVDGQVVLDVPKCAPGAPPDSKCGVFFDAPYHLLLNTAIGGPWPQPPDEGTAFPGYHRVDWVRVSSKQRPR